MCWEQQAEQNGGKEINMSLQMQRDVQIDWVGGGSRDQVPDRAYTDRFMSKSPGCEGYRFFERNPGLLKFGSQGDLCEFLGLISL